MQHFSATKFYVGYEKNMSFFVIPKPPKKVEKIGLGSFNVISYRDCCCCLELAQFPVTTKSEGGVRKAGLRAHQREVHNLCLYQLAEVVVDAIWLDLGALNQDYYCQSVLKLSSHILKHPNRMCALYKL